MNLPNPIGTPESSAVTQTEHDAIEQQYQEAMAEAEAECMGYNEHPLTPTERGALDRGWNGLMEDMHRMEMRDKKETEEAQPKTDQTEEEKCLETALEQGYTGNAKPWKLESPQMTCEELVNGLVRQAPRQESIGLGDFVPPQIDPNQRENVMAYIEPTSLGVPRADEAGKIHPGWLPGVTGQVGIKSNDNTAFVHFEIVHGIIVDVYKKVWDDEKQTWIREYGQRESF